MKLIIYSVILFSISGCEQVVGEISSRLSGHVQDSIIQSVNNGKQSDNLKQTYLKSIQKGINDLKQLNDPNIQEVYDLIDKQLKDNDLSMYDYNVISKLIGKHKRELIANQSTHKNDVAEFKNNLTR